jgi:hypothetical protein
MRLAFLSKDSAGKLFLGVWIVVVAGIMTFQMATHAVSLPLPAEVSALGAEIARVSGAGTGRWVYAHVIPDRCSCTASLLKHLLARGPLEGASEAVFVLGDQVPFEKELEARGYKVRRYGQDEFVGKFGVEAAPLLAAMDGAGKLRYVGGYFRTSATQDPQDGEILRKLGQGESVVPLPLYGCAVSQRLRRYIDPFGVSRI